MSLEWHSMECSVVKPPLLAVRRITRRVIKGADV
jgi:hypothetical protein